LRFGISGIGQLTVVRSGSHMVTTAAQQIGLQERRHRCIGLAQCTQHGRGIFVAVGGCLRQIQARPLGVSWQKCSCKVQNAQPVLRLEVAGCSSAGVERLGLGHIALFTQAIFGQDAQVEQGVAIAHLGQRLPDLAGEVVMRHLEFGIGLVVAHGRIAQPVGPAAVLRLNHDRQPAQGQPQASPHKAQRPVGLHYF